MDAKIIEALSEIDASLNEEEKNPKTLLYIFARIKIVIDSGSNHKLIYKNKNLMKLIRYFLCDKDREVRVASLRTLRYISTSDYALKYIRRRNILHFVVRSFETEGRSNERVEACKFIKNWLELSPTTFPMAFMAALVSLAEAENDDELKDFAVEAVRLLSVSNTALVAWCGGFRVLINSIFNLKADEGIVNNTILTLLYLLNNKETRQYLKKEKELARILAIFTDTEMDIRESELEGLISLGKRVIIMMSRSWVGLIFLASGGLRQIIENICLPIKPKIKEAILEIIEEMITIPVETMQTSKSLLKNYLAMLLKALIHCNLYKSLTHLAIEKSDPMAQRARKLLKVVTSITSDLLPDAPQFSLMLDTHKSVIAAELVAEIDSCTRLKDNFSHLGIIYRSCEMLSKEPFSFIESQNTVISGIYKNYALGMIDDNEFNNLIKKSHVLKETKKWKWEIIYQIMAGPIDTPPRFYQALKTRFLKCLLSYYMPSRGLFSVLEWHPNNFIKAQVGTLLLGLLLSQTEGVILLTTTINEGFFVMRKCFIAEIADGIDDEIAVKEQGKMVSNRLFSPDKMKVTMVREYFKWVGLMTNYRTGIALLNSSNLDSKLMKLSTVEHLSTVVIPYLNYRETISQDFLIYSLQSDDILVRKHAMEHLRLLFRAGAYDITWAVREIVNQLYSPDHRIVSCALSVIEELCTDNNNLRVFIETGPQTLTRLGEEGAKCLISFLSSSSGISYLSQLDFIQKEMEKWKTKGNFDYVKKIEHQSEIALTSQKKVYALDIHTPFANSYNDRLEPLWLRKLPFTIIVYISGSQKTYSLNTWVEISDDVYIVGQFPEVEVLENDCISVCMQLGIYNIDSRGQQTSDCNWIKCQPQDRDLDVSNIIEKFGVSFKFTTVKKTKFLTEVSYRVQVLPKATASIKFPKHLYGELVQTKLGLKKLQESKHVNELVEYLKTDSQIIQKRVSLWGLGHIGSSERGVHYLNALGAISIIVEIAEKSSTLSLRGTAFQSLCLVASTNAGRKELLKYGWICSQSKIALPAQSEKIFWLENDDDFKTFKEKCEEHDRVIDTFMLSNEEQEILSHIIGLGNVVRRSESETYLKAKRMSSPHSFVSVPLFHAVMSYITVFSFKLSTRKIVHKLFEKMYSVQKKIDEIDSFKHIY